MKKMLTLVLVLAIASLANAGLYTASSTQPFVITLTAADAAAAADAFIDYTPLVAAGLNVNLATITPGAASVANLFVFTAAVDGADVYSVAMGHTADWASGAVLATIDLNGAAPNVGSTPVTLNLLDADLNTIGSVSVMIPEPITMALLGIGGLFFRRKK